VPLVRDVLERMRAAGLERRAARRRRHHPAGGRPRCCAPGRRRVYTPKDFDLNAIMADIVRIVAESNAAA
jgi:(2R)-ethylmalonyl-CoA mutase